MKKKKGGGGGGGCGSSGFKQGDGFTPGLGNREKEDELKIRMEER